MDNRLKKTTGFTLIELISTIVLVGIIGVFTSFFIYSAVNSFIYTKEANEGALKAQIALDRISLELRDIDEITAFTADTSINYTSGTLPFARRIVYDGDANAISIGVDDGGGYTENVLLDNVIVFSLSQVLQDLDDAGVADDIAGLSVSFTLSEISRPFNLRIYPRNLL